MKEGTASDLLTRSECKRRFDAEKSNGLTKAAFLLVDVDDFSRFNILYDHSFGDLFLEKTMGDIAALFSEPYVACRYGVDQMLIAGYGKSIDDMDELYWAIVRYAQHGNVLGKVSYRFSVSGGIGFYPDDGTEWDEIEKSLSLALQKAKSDGGGQAVLFTDALLAEGMRKQELVLQVADDVNDGFRGFELAFQPVCESGTLSIHGAEALLRYSTKAGKSVSPAELVPLLESTGLIKSVGLMVLERAIATCSEWLEYQPDFAMNVNLSLVQLADRSFSDAVMRLVERYAVDPERIVLELTESYYLDDDEAVVGNISTLRQMGFSFAVDDFGTGYSSLSRLMVMDCDVIKIDRSFVPMLNANTANYDFIHSVVELCHKSNKRVCVEGVEEIEDLQAINSMQADYIQGFYVSRPVSKHRFEKAFLETGFDGTVLLFTPDAAFRTRQLSSNRDLLRSIVNAMPISMHLMNSRNEVVMCNAAMLELFGCPADEDQIGLFDELSPQYQPDGRLSAEEANEQISLVRARGRLTLTWEHVSRTGEPLPVEVTLVKLDIYDEYNENLLACFLRDLRPQIQAEQRERRFNQKLSAILDAMPFCLNLWNHRLENVMCNKEAVKLFDLDNEQQYLDEFECLSPPYQPDGKPSGEKAREKVKEAFRTGKCTFGWMHSKFSGEEIPAEITLVKIDMQDDEGHDLVAGFTRDMRDRSASLRSATGAQASSGAFFYDMTELLPYGVAILTADDAMTVNYANDGYHCILETVFGDDGSAEIEPDPSFADVVSPKDRQKLRSEWREQLARGDNVNLEFRISTGRGEKWVSLTGSLKRSEVGSDIVVCTIVDVSSNKALIDALRIDKSFWDMVSSISDELFFRLTIASTAVENFGRMVNSFDMEPFMTGFPECVIERGIVYEDDIPLFRTFGNRMLAGIVEPIDVRLVLASGECRWYRIVYDCLYGTDGEPVMAAGKAVDIQAEKDLEQKARIDLLTWCYNKMSFEEEVDALIARMPLEERGAAASSADGQNAAHAPRAHDDYAFFIVDIDDFKAINDTLGHHFGDLVLVELAAGLRSCFEEDAVIGRIGGDEFVVFSNGFEDVDSIVETARTIALMLGRVSAELGDSYRITVSVGVARYPLDGTSFSELYQASDKALYQTKKRAKGGFTLYDTSMVFGTTVDKTAVENADRSAYERFDAALVSTAFNLLYETNDIETSVNAVIKFIGAEMQADRCYVFETFDEGVHYSNTFEWCNAKTPSVIDRLQNFEKQPWNELFELDADGAITCDDCSHIDHPGASRMLDDHGIRSFFHAQVKDEGYVATVLGVDDCVGGRVWSENEKSSLVYVSKIISTFLLRERYNRRLQEFCATQQSILEGSNAFTYIVDPNDLTILYANQQLKLFSPEVEEGKACYRAIRSKDEPCRLCPVAMLGERSILPPIEVMDNGRTLISTVKKVTWKDKTDAILIDCLDVTEKEDFPSA
ncbi:EAL domain-containing protein [Raoultibacter phocaeensis]|uniref:EAL domain-containing protein n=1 Tax=Raoultibacter phocaeensis TaxID=2479841 RepID=UPI00111B4BF1|nr:EAL domain-containing protein [Raoultibacter phocaeensis]